MPALALAVVQSDREIDPAAALATLPDARRYLLRSPELSGDPHLPGVRVQHVAVTARAAAAALVRRDSGAEVVVVLIAGEAVSPALASALATIGADDGDGGLRGRARAPVSRPRHRGRAGGDRVAR